MFLGKDVDQAMMSDNEDNNKIDNKPNQSRVRNTNISGEYKRLCLLHQ